MEIDIYEFYEKVESKKDFELFLKVLVKDFKVNKEEWDNDNLGSFLEGLYGYNFGSETDINVTKPSWKDFAEMLLAARVYE